MRRFLVSEDGPTAVEYAVMLSLIICVCLAAITTIGTSASSVFSKCANSLVRPPRRRAFRPGGLICQGQSDKRDCLVSASPLLFCRSPPKTTPVRPLAGVSA